MRRKSDFDTVNSLKKVLAYWAVLLRLRTKGRSRRTISLWFFFIWDTSQSLPGLGSPPSGGPSCTQKSEIDTLLCRFLLQMLFRTFQRNQNGIRLFGSCFQSGYLFPINPLLYLSFWRFLLGTYTNIDIFTSSHSGVLCLLELLGHLRHWMKV